MIRVAPCPKCAACGSPGATLYDGLTDDLFAAPGTWALTECLNLKCGLLWLNPMPQDEDLHLAYREYYTHADTLSKGLGFRIGKAAYRFAVDAFLLVGNIPAERKRAARMFLQPEAGASLLDIGCGQGTFLGKMARDGWNVMGVDFDAAAVEAARALHNIDVRVGTVDTIIQTGQLFDVVTASHVIEHVTDPREFLAKCRALLRPNGRMILKTPNVGSLGHKIYGRFWRGLEPPRHLHLFTIQSLISVARDAGFQSVETFTTSVGAEGILLASYMMRRNGNFRPSTLSGSEQALTKLLGPLFALRAKFSWLVNRGAGEEICAVLKK